MSIQDYIIKRKEQGVPGYEIDLKVSQIIRNIPASIRQLSREFEVEENSIAKLIIKLTSRIPPSDVDETESPYEQLFRFFSDNQDKSLEYFLSWIMTPLVGSWVRGKTKIGTAHYALLPFQVNSWAVAEVEYTKGARDILRAEPKYIEAIEYASNKWQLLFVKRP